MSWLLIAILLTPKGQYRTQISLSTSTSALTA